MKVEFVEAPGFTEVVEEYFGSDDAYILFQQFLSENPQAGAVVPGCGGLRKVRWPDPRRGKGKRGGLRVLYLHVPEMDHIFVVDVYDKNEADDLTAAERRVLSAMARDYREGALG